MSLRTDRVIGAIKADMDFESAIDRGDDSAIDRTREARNRAMSGMTPEEVNRVAEARDRHGYGA